MKRWALIVVALYVVIIIVLTVPAILLAFGSKVGVGGAIQLYASWPYWIWLLVMGVSQLTLLAVPVRVAGLRPVSRGPIWRTVFVGALMAGGLVSAALVSLDEFLYPNYALNHAPKTNWDAWLILAMGLLTWCVWTVIFSRMSRNIEPSDLLTRQCQWLFKGSVLELLIAVPTHIVARYRDYCCAGFLTFLGLTMGVSVMLFAFGPAVFVLFVQRWKRLHPKSNL